MMSLFSQLQIIIADDTGIVYCVFQYRPNGIPYFFPFHPIFEGTIIILLIGVIFCNVIEYAAFLRLVAASSCQGDGLLQIIIGRVILLKSKINISCQGKGGGSFLFVIA